MITPRHHRCIVDDAAVDVRFATRQLERRYAQIAEAIRAWGPQVGPRYVTRINALRDAATIEDVYAMRQLDLHPLTGDRRGQHAIRLTGAMHLIVTIEDDAFIVQEVTDYHG